MLGDDGISVVVQLDSNETRVSSLVVLPGTVAEAIRNCNRALETQDVCNVS